MVGDSNRWIVWFTNLQQNCQCHFELLHGTIIFALMLQHSPNIVIGRCCWIFRYAVLSWLLPYFICTAKLVRELLLSVHQMEPIFAISLSMQQIRFCWAAEGRVWSRSVYQCWEGNFSRTIELAASDDWRTEACSSMGSHLPPRATKHKTHDGDTFLCLVWTGRLVTWMRHVFHSLKETTRSTGAGEKLNIVFTINRENKNCPKSLCFVPLVHK